MSFNVIELFPGRHVDMSKFRKGNFKPGLISYEAIDPSKETSDLKRGLETLSGSFDLLQEEIESIEQFELAPKIFQPGHFDVYNRNASVVTYTLEHGEKINKKI